MTQYDIFITMSVLAGIFCVWGINTIANMAIMMNYINVKTTDASWEHAMENYYDPLSFKTFLGFKHWFYKKSTIWKWDELFSNYM